MTWVTTTNDIHQIGELVEVGLGMANPYREAGQPMCHLVTPKETINTIRYIAIQCVNVCRITLFTYLVLSPGFTRRTPLPNACGDELITKLPSFQRESID